MPAMNTQHNKNALWRHAAVSLALAALTPALLAATTEADDLGQVVTATRTASRIDAVVADVTVIGREQIAASAGQSLSQVLARQAGLQLSSNGGLGKASSLYVRGGQPRHTLVLVDGVRFGSATSGTPSLENFPLEAIDHIEVVRGPMASLYGSDAVAGVIQVFTRRGRPGSQVDASVTGGSDGFHQVTGAWSGGVERWQGAVTVSDQATRGFSATNRLASSTSYHPDLDGFRQQSLQGSLSHDIATGWRVRWQGFVAQGDNELDDGQLASKPGLNTRSDVRSSVQSLALSGRLMPNWRSQWRVARSYDSSNTYVARLASRLGRFATTQRQVSWDNTLEVPHGTALVALDHVEQGVQATTKYPVRNRTMDALVLGWSGEQGPHAWQLSARHDHNSQYGDQPTAAAAYGFEFSPGWRAGASIGSTFSAPTFNDLYYPDRSSNPNMPPQEGVSKELSLTRLLEQGRWRVAYHRNDVRGYIQSTSTQVLSTPHVRMEGLTLSADQDWDTAWGQWGLHGSADWLNAIDQDSGKHLKRRANGVFQGQLTHQLGRWQQALGATVRDGMFDDDDNTAAKRLGGVGLWHASVRYQVDRDWAVAFRVDNLTDRRYQTAWGYNQARRQCFLTLSYSQAKPKP